MFERYFSITTIIFDDKTLHASMCLDRGMIRLRLRWFGKLRLITLCAVVSSSVNGVDSPLLTYCKRFTSIRRIKGRNVCRISLRLGTNLFASLLRNFEGTMRV